MWFKLKSVNIERREDLYFDSIVAGIDPEKAIFGLESQLISEIMPLG